MPAPHITTVRCYRPIIKKNGKIYRVYVFCLKVPTPDTAKRFVYDNLTELRNWFHIFKKIFHTFRKVKGLKYSMINISTYLHNYPLLYAKSFAPMFAGLAK